MTVIQAHAAEARPRISVIVPALNEADNIENLLGDLQPMRARGHEVIVVDGDSVDQTAVRARPLCDRLAHGPRGRARQMNVGAQLSSGEILWFVHADSRLPTEADIGILRALKSGRRNWGRFEVRLQPCRPLLSLVAFMMNLRSRLSGIATGDQGIFIRRRVFSALGGYADIELMEDIEISRRLKSHGRPACLSATLTTSSRRWERHGVLQTVLLMWRLRAAYALGADPRLLAQRYSRDG